MSVMTRPFDVRTRRGFTLIELLVVIGIILLLVALTLTVGTSVVRQSEVRETQNTLSLLEIAVDEWERSAERRVLYGIEGEPCNLPLPRREQYELGQVDRAGVDIDADFSWDDDSIALGDTEATSDRMWQLFSQNVIVREQLLRINPDFILELDPNDPPNGVDLNHLQTLSYRFIDAWGNPIFAVLPGRKHDPVCDGNDYTVDDRVDDDGTIRTAFENRFGVAANRRIYFVSAGPDGVFGNLHLDIATSELNADQQQDIEDAADNIYSYPVIINQARPQP